MILVEGGISVKATMLGGKRDVQEVILDQARHDKDAHFIEQKANELGIHVTKTTKEEIDHIASGKTHGGVLAYVSKRRYQSLSDAFTGVPYVVVLEGVEDPYNLGYVMRTVYTSGCTGLIIRNRDWSNAESTILKSSAGAFEYLNVICSDDIAEDVRVCKQHGLHAYAAMRKDAIAYWDGKYEEPVLIAIGGEMRGLSSKVLKEMDTNIYIPYANDFRAALNAAGAAAAISFEVFRQRENA